MSRRVVAMALSLVLAASACAQATDADQATGATTAGASVAESTTSTNQAAPSTTAVSEATTTEPVDEWVPVGTAVTEPDGEESPEVLALMAAFEASSDVVSGRMEGSIEWSGLDPSSGLTEMVVPFRGAFDNTSGDVLFLLDLSGPMAATGEEPPADLVGPFGEMEVRQIGETTFVKGPRSDRDHLADTPWTSMPTDEFGPSGYPAASPVNPSEMLGSLADAGATVEVIGRETVNGVEASRYKAIFDTEALFAQASPEERERLEFQGLLATEFLPMDAWISDDGLVVRFIMEIDADSIDTEPEGSFDQILIRYDMFDLNAEVVIDSPPPGEVTDFEGLWSDMETESLD